MENNVVIKGRSKCRNTKRKHLVTKPYVVSVFYSRGCIFPVNFRRFCYLHIKKQSSATSGIKRKIPFGAISKLKAQRTVTEIKGYKYMFTSIIALKCIIYFRSFKIGVSHLKYIMEWAIVVCLFPVKGYVLRKSNCLMMCGTPQIYLYSAL